MRLREQKRAIVHTYSTHFVSTVRDCLVLLACRRAQGEDVRVAHREADGPWHDVLAGEDARLPLGGRVVDDVRQILENSVTFNGPTHWLSLKATEIYNCALQFLREVLRTYSTHYAACVQPASPRGTFLQCTVLARAPYISTYATVQYMSV